MKMNAKWIIGIIFVATLIFPIATAFELNPFANVKTYEPVIKEDMPDFIKEDFNPKYGVIRLSNTFFWIETSKIAEYSLIENTEQCLVNCEARGKAVLYENGVLFDEFIFKNFKTNKNRDLEYSVFIADGIEFYEEEIPVYGTVCEDIEILGELKKNLCYEKVIKTEKVIKNRTKWVKYDGKELFKGDYEWKLAGKKGLYENIDWIAIKEKSFDEWASWNSSFNEKLIYVWDWDNEGTTLTEKISGVSNGTFYNGMGFLSGGKHINSSNVIANKDMYVSLGSDSLLDEMFNIYSTTNKTISFWLNVTSWTSGGDYGAIFHKGVDPNVFSLWKFSSTNLIDIICKEGSDADNLMIRWAVGNSTNNNIWIHIVLTINGNKASGINLYRNGETLSKTTLFDTNNGNGCGNILSSNGEFGHQGSGSTGFLDGRIDEFYLWNRTLTESEIADLYNSGAGIFYSSNTLSVTLNSPNDSYTTTNPSITFNCSATDETGVENLTLIIDGEDNYTITGGAGQNLSLQVERTLSEGIHNWTCRASDDGSEQTASIRELIIDYTPPNLTIIHPTQDQVIYNESNIYFNFTVKDATTTDDCGYSIDGNANKSLYSICHSTGLVTSSDLFNLTTNKLHTIVFWANDTLGNFNSTSVSFYSFDYESSIDKTTAIEGESVTLNLSLIGDSIGNYYPNTNATLTFRETSYDVSATVNQNNIFFEKTITIPNLDSDEEINYNWTFNIKNATDTLYTKLVSETLITYNMQFGLCNSTLNVSFLNLTFKSEVDLSRVNASIVSTFTNSRYSWDETYDYINTTENKEYVFCVYPSYASLTSEVLINYYNSGSAQRSYSDILLLSNTTTYKTLYLLPTASGMFVSFQILSQTGQPISSASVGVSRTISGEVVQIGNSLTDSSGIATFFLNPFYPHTITVTKLGYGTTTSTITPTQSMYSIIMQGTTSNNMTYTSPIDGIWWIRTPLSGVIETGVTTFTYNVTSSIYNITKCKFELLNSTKSIIDFVEKTSINSENCYLTLNYDVQYGTVLYGRYYVDVGSGYIMIESDGNWHTLYNASAVSPFSLKYILSYFSSDLSLTDEEEKKYEFTKLVLFFVTFAIILAFLNNQTNFDMISPGIALIGIPLLLWLLSIPYNGNSFLYIKGATPFAFLDNFIIALLSTLIACASWVRWTRGVQT